MLASTTCGLAPKRSVIHLTVGSRGRVYNQLTSPSAKKFLERSASRGLTPASLQTSCVMEVIGTS